MARQVGTGPRTPWLRAVAILAAGIAGATALVFLAFGAHVLSGRAFEARTVAAMTLRTGLWALIAFATSRWLLGPAPQPGR